MWTSCTDFKQRRQHIMLTTKYFTWRSKLTASRMRPLLSKQVRWARWVVSHKQKLAGHDGCCEMLNMKILLSVNSQHINMKILLWSQHITWRCHCRWTVSTSHDTKKLNLVQVDIFNLCESTHFPKHFVNLCHEFCQWFAACQSFSRGLLQKLITWLLSTFVITFAAVSATYFKVSHLDFLLHLQVQHKCPTESGVYGVAVPRMTTT